MAAAASFHSESPEMLQPAEPAMGTTRKKKRVIKKNVKKASPAAVRKQGSTQKKAVDKRTKVELLPQSVAACLRGITPSQPVTVWTVASDCSGLCTEGLASKLAFGLHCEVQVVHKYASESCPKKRPVFAQKKDQFKSIEESFFCLEPRMKARCPRAPGNLSKMPSVLITFTTICRPAPLFPQRCGTTLTCTGLASHASHFHLPGPRRG